MSDKIQFRRDTTANWTSVNPILSDGEPGYDKDLEQFKVGDGVTAWLSLPWAVNGAVVNDGVTNGTDTWSSTKISTSIAAAISDTQTAAPTLSVGSVSGNEGATSEVTITNYNAGFTYTVTSSNPQAFTVSRTGAVITVTHVAVSANDTGSLIVTAQDPTKTNAGSVQITVTTYNVDVADTQIQVVDFSAIEFINYNFSYTEGLLATADGATFISDPIAQGGGETNWKKFTPKVYLKYKKYTPLATISNNVYVAGITDDMSSCNKQMFIDSAGNEFFTTNNTSFSYFSDANCSYGPDPGTVTGWGPANWSTSGDISLTGLKIIQSSNTNCSIMKATLSTPFVIPASLTFSSVSLSTHLSITNRNFGCVEFSSDGKYLFLGDDTFTPSDTSGYGVTRLTLATPYDEATVVVGSALVFRPTSTQSPNLYNSTNYGFTVSPCGKYLYLYKRDVSLYTQCRIDCLVTVTPFNFTSSTLHSSYTNSSSGNYLGTYGGNLSFCGFRKLRISEDGKRIIIVHGYVTSATPTGLTYISAATLTTPFNISTLPNFTGSYKGSSTIAFSHNVIISPDGSYIYIYESNSASSLIRATGNYFTKPPSFSLAGLSPIGDIVEMYVAGTAIPSMYVDTDTVSGNLDHTTAPQIAASNTPALFTRDGTYATKTITYTETACDASVLQFKITADNKTPIEKITIDLAKAA